ncbi:hypothetical protein D0Z07_3060 [Hyphodiscus hymeniophilus]|uniref:Uncharacterized protein n=1 Tax=Hyphodiscus hymeniophilus TaxID=353542 RepID=A0A9P6VLM5_9HELO|nr:hypothetical protein D0Z07_3060 [Hyphodiscus hymeniophilus]
MLRRNSSKRLGRRKSTSSAHSRHEPIDPEVARQHAHRAATLAFARAQERHSADMGCRPGGFVRSNTNFSDRSQQYNPPSGEATPKVVRRQHSVRFAGPNAVRPNLQRRQSAGARALHNPSIPRPSPASLRPMAMTTNDPVPAAYRPPSRSSSIGKASTGKAVADSYVTALAAYNEYYTQEDDMASTPSSYRRIRRSKSMFSPLKAPNVFYTNGTPERPVSGFRSDEQSMVDSQTPGEGPPTAALRAPKSMSFLRGGRDHLTAGLRERNDEAVKMARDRFFHQTSQQRLREQPSFLFRSRVQRQEKPFRQSVRTSSTNSYGMPIASTNQVEQPKESKLKTKARRASKTIKDKLRRAFGRSKEDPVEIPNQQVDAHETHVRRYPGQGIVANDSFENIPHPNQTTLHRVASRPPSIHPANSTQELRSHAGSVKSFQSDHSDDRSRVTSWNSTGVNTIASHAVRTQSERDLQRLSVINENGTHVPTSSFHRQKLANQFSAYPIIRRPSNGFNHIPPPHPGPVDSARVYSALMKRLDENSPKAKLEAAKKASQENLNAPKSFPPRTSSVHSSHASRTPATIRQVPESTCSSENGGSADHDHHWVKADAVHCARAENVFGYTGAHVHQWIPADPLREARMRDQDDVFSPKTGLTNKENVPDRKENTPIPFKRGRSDSAATKEGSVMTSYHTVPEHFGLTPQETAARDEPMFQGARTVRETKSTFFGGSSGTIARTQSPFRRALAEADYNVNRGISVILDDFPIPNPLNIRPQSYTTAGPGINKLGETSKAYTESVYSRTTSGQLPGPAHSSLSLPLAEDEIPEMRFQNTSIGDVVILDRATYRPVMPSPNGHRATSSASSTEWKKWMSSEVAKLERAKDQNSAGSYVNYALPTMPKSFHAGHVRESAQINDDDTDIAQTRVSAVKQPLGLIQQKAVQNMQHSLQNPPLLKPILKNRSAISLVDNLDPTSSNPSIPIPPPPPIPLRSPLRPVQSKSSLRSVNTVNTFRTVHTQSAPNSAVKFSSLNGKNFLHKRNTSQTTLHSTRSLDTPAKLLKRSLRKVSNTAAAPSPEDGIVVSNGDNFNPTSTGARSRTASLSSVVNRENHHPQKRDDVYDTDDAGLTGPVMSGAAQGLDAQQMGSKRMVDLFLSSRRKRMASEGGSEIGGVFI